MLHHSDDLEIQRLADETGVSVRTIRFYQEQGLMPAPGTRGKAFLYGQSDLDRLRLIKALQAERLTLAEIREQTAPMDDQEVARELDRLRHDRRSAAEYARAVRLGAAGATHSPRSAYPPSSPAGTTWERIALGRRIELHIQRPLSHREEKLVRRLIELARNTLKDGETP